MIPYAIIVIGNKKAIVFLFPKMYIENTNILSKALRKRSIKLNNVYKSQCYFYPVKSHKYVTNNMFKDSIERVKICYEYFKCKKTNNKKYTSVK